MWKLLTFDGRLVSRGTVARHVLSASTLLLVGFLVVALVQLRGGPSSSLVDRGQSLPYCPTATAAPAAFVFDGQHPRTVTKTVTKTKTKTVTQTRTQTLCRFVTVTQPGTTDTATTTSTVTTTEPAVTSTAVTTATVTEQGPTVTSTVTVTGTQSTTTGNPGAGFTCPPQDAGGFPLGTSNATADPIFCSYPAFVGEDPNDFFCTYSATTGALVTDNNAGFCPATAAAKA